MPPRSSLYGGFLVHAVGFCLWGQHPGWDSVWVVLWKVLLGRSEKKAPFFIMVCFQPIVHCCFAFRLRACMGVYINVISLWQRIGSFSGTRKKNKFDHLGAGSWYPREVSLERGHARLTLLGSSLC